MRVSLCLLTVWLFLACVGRGEIAPIPSWSKSMAKEKYILTPKAPEVHRLIVYGAALEIQKKSLFVICGIKRI